MSRIRNESSVVLALGLGLGLSGGTRTCTNTSTRSDRPHEVLPILEADRVFVVLRQQCQPTAQKTNRVIDALRRRRPPAAVTKHVAPESCCFPHGVAVGDLRSKLEVRMHVEYAYL
jgi:hypothetical protein